jgi:hypothetical protein
MGKNRQTRLCFEQSVCKSIIRCACIACKVFCVSLISICDCHFSRTASLHRLPHVSEPSNVHRPIKIMAPSSNCSHLFRVFNTPALLPPAQVSRCWLLSEIREFDCGDRLHVESACYRLLFLFQTLQLNLE